MNERSRGGDENASALVAIAGLIAAADYTAAITRCRRQLAAEPQDAATWGLLASALAAGGDINEAGKSLARAIACAPGEPAYHVQMGELYARLQRAGDAAACFERALALVPEHLPALHGRGNALWAQGDLVAARQTYQRIVSLRGDDAFAERNLRLINGRLVERWHFPMVSDGPRNTQYQQALCAAIDRDSVVLDIGAGTGLLSMMAARAGARHVIACESNPAMAELAREIIAHNGLSEKITVLGKPSFQIDPQADFPAGLRPNLIVAEIFDATVIGEGALASFAHARTRLAADGARIVPARARLHGVLIESDMLWREGAADHACGFDLRMLNRYRPDCVGVEAHGFQGVALSDDFAIFDFDFSADAATGTAVAELDIEVTRAGVCHGVAYWMQLQLDEERVLDNRPDLGEGVSAMYCAHWHQMVRLLVPAIAVQPGMRMRIRAQHNRHAVALSVFDPVTGLPGC
jgi:tetratricopeptide (TPR) repeat protein